MADTSNSVLFDAPVPRAGAPFASSTGSQAFCSRWCSCLSSCACTTRRTARISSAGSCGSPPSNVKRGPISTCRTVDDHQATVVAVVGAVVFGLVFGVGRLLPNPLVRGVSAR